MGRGHENCNLRGATAVPWFRENLAVQPGSCLINFVPMGCYRFADELPYLSLCLPSLARLVRVKLLVVVNFFCRLLDCHRVPGIRPGSRHRLGRANLWN